MRLLIVDDDPIVTTMLAKILRRNGYAVDLAATCEGAEELTDVNSYDVLLLDWNLPDGPGFACANSFEHAATDSPSLLSVGARALVTGFEPWMRERMTM